MTSKNGSSSQLPPSSTSAHRLPTISASDALHKLRAQPHAVSTGLPRLDAILSDQLYGDRGVSSGTSGIGLNGGGLVRGQITEVYGPPGVGKTAFCMQAAASALHAGEKVVWIDTTTPMAFARLDDFLLGIREAVDAASSSEDLSRTGSTLADLRSRFHYYTVPTLPHLLAMFLHPTVSFPPAGTSLIVIDSISRLFENAYPRPYIHAASKKNEAAKWAAGRKFTVMGEVISKLGRMAAVNNIAVLLTSQTMTRMRSDLGALLLPAISGAEWDNGVSTQLVLFRDWPPRHISNKEDDVDRWKGLRYVGIIKLKGVAAAHEGSFETVVPFSIEKDGLYELASATAKVAVPIMSSPTRPLKRPFKEIADSEGEGEESLSEDDYGWTAGDEIVADLLESNVIHTKVVKDR